MSVHESPQDATMTRAYTFSATITSDGKLDVPVPVAPGTPVNVVLLLPEEDETSDLVAAASTSLGFWDNPIDDEEWNNA